MIRDSFSMYKRGEKRRVTRRCSRVVRHLITLRGVLAHIKLPTVAIVAAVGQGTRVLRRLSTAGGALDGFDVIRRVGRRRHIDLE